MDYSKSDIPEFKCHKKVKAFKICTISKTDDGFLVMRGEGVEYKYAVKVADRYFKKHDPQIGGYYVLYKDGYESYSPADAFEDGYSLEEEDGTRAMNTKCQHCGSIYAADNWIEAVIPDKVWAEITPTKDTNPKGGILCIACISKILKKAGYDYRQVPVWFCGMEPLKLIPGDPMDNIDLLRSWSREAP